MKLRQSLRLAALIPAAFMGEPLVNNSRDANAQFIIAPQIYIPQQRGSGSGNRRKRSQPRAAQPAQPSEPRWYSTSIGSKQIATNGQGIAVSYNDSGELTVELNCLQPCFSFEAGAQVPVQFNVSGASNTSAIGTLKDDKTQVIVSGANAGIVAQALKSGSRVNAIFLTNNLSSRLRGSRDVITQIELAAAQWKASHQGVKAAVRDIKEEVAQEFNQRLGELEHQIAVWNRVLQQQERRLTITVLDSEKVSISETIKTIKVRINELSEEMRGKEADVEYYLTNIRPQDRDIYVSARKRSEIEPQAPYYIPGTNETGQFWVEPVVTNEGILQFNFRMIDPLSPNDTTRSLIPMSLDQLKDVQQAIKKLSDMSKTAHKNKIRKNYSKRVVCFPELECPDERSNGTIGKSSTEVIFQIYEDGSTAGRIQQNKGPYQEGFNISIETANYFQAYLDLVIEDAKSDYSAGTKTVKDLDKLFE